MTKMTSVLQDWVQQMTFRQQGVLVLALRGPDGVPKEDAAKPIVRTLRALVLMSGRDKKPMDLNIYFKDDLFMTTYWIANVMNWHDKCKAFFDNWDAYNVHFLQHLLHAYAVVGIGHPNDIIKDRCWNFYVQGCNKLHMNAETPSDIEYRLRDGVRDEKELTAI